MQQFADLELVNCETVTKKVKMVQDICDTSMSYDDDTHPQTKHAILMKGLRLVVYMSCINEHTCQSATE